MPLMRRAFLFILLSVSALAEGFCQFTAGPEIFQFIRQREGGMHQEGLLKGIRVNFDRIKRYSLYYGIDYLYSNGDLTGQTATGRSLLSELTDQIIELRFGFTFQQQTTTSPFFIPFAGWGYFHEKNEFFFPSPIPCTFTDTFHYFAAGFLSGINFTPLLSIGINFKLKFTQDAKSLVTDDPMYDEVTLMIKDELLIRLDLPIYYHPSPLWLRTGIELCPFFEYRHFGGREGYPFNFKDTKFYLYGARFALTFPF